MFDERWSNTIGIIGVLTFAGGGLIAALVANRRIFPEPVPRSTVVAWITVAIAGVRLASAALAAKEEVYRSRKP
jgi:hypothetical protein